MGWGRGRGTSDGGRGRTTEDGGHVDLFDNDVLARAPGDCPTGYSVRGLIKRPSGHRGRSRPSGEGNNDDGDYSSETGSGWDGSDGEKHLDGMHGRSRPMPDHQALERRTTPRGA